MDNKTINDDWDKLSVAEQHKVRDLSCPDWENVRVYAHAKDTREGKEYNKCQYGILEIFFTRNDKEYRTVISAQPSGHRFRSQKNMPKEKVYYDENGNS